MSALAGERQAIKARQRRRMYPLHAYLGRNGSSKSACLVWDTLPDLEAGLPVLSTVRLLDYQHPRPCEGYYHVWEDGRLQQIDCDHPRHGHPKHLQAHPLWAKFYRWTDLMTWERGPVLMDEITGVAASGDNDLPPVVKDALHRLRAADLSVRITGISWIRINKMLREVINAVTRCRSSLPVAAFHDDGTERMWRARRLAKHVTYDAQTLPIDDHTEHAYDEGQVLVKGRLWIPMCPAIKAYDTFDLVYRVGDATDAGRCVTCAGVRRVPECSCADYVADRDARAVARKARSAEDGGVPARRARGRVEPLPVPVARHRAPDELVVARAVDG